MSKSATAAIIVAVIVILGGLLYFKSVSTPSNTAAPAASTTMTTQDNQTPAATADSAVASASPSGVTTLQSNVTLSSGGFSPATLTIKAGTTVTWTNKSGEDATVNSDPHPIHTDYPPLNLGRFADGQSLTLKFDQPGTYGYHDHLNPSLKGTIIVQ